MSGFDIDGEGESIAGFYGHYDPKWPLAAFIMVCVAFAVALLVLVHVLDAWGKS